jgi:phosphohistidine phosphatase
MDVFLVRHAVAEDGEDDAARPLSRKGARRFAQTARGLVELELPIATVLHSPRLRAMQTAELLSAPFEAQLRVSAELDGPPSEALLDALTEGAALVGHEPHLSTLLAWLVTGDQRLARAFELKKGSVAWLSGEPRPGKMVLTALLPPFATRAAR